MLNRLFRKIILLTYDICVHLAEWPRIALLRLIDYSDLVRKLEASGTERLALVAPHPSKHLQFTIQHLIKGLLKNKYTVVVLIPDPAKAQWLKEAFPEVHLERRKPQGRDFGAWKEVVLAITGSSILRRSINRLVLANDSIYYNKTTAEIIERLTKSEKQWSCLFENFDYHYHAQSFLLSFDNVAINHPVFRKFWQNYRPYSSRRHSINRGEALLSKRMSRVFGRPDCILNSTRIMKEFRSIDTHAELRSAMFRLWASPATRAHAGKTLEASFTAFGFRTGKQGHRNEPTKEDQSFEREMLAIDISKLPEAQNPTHSVGLLVNYLFMYPVKRDICLRSWHRISDVVTLLRGFSEHELSDIERDLRLTGLPDSYGGIRRILFEFGRI